MPTRRIKQAEWSFSVLVNDRVADHELVYPLRTNIASQSCSSNHQKLNIFSPNWSLFEF